MSSAPLVNSSSSMATLDLTSEQIGQLIQMTRVKKEAGSTEQNDAEYARNLAILRLLTQQQKTVNNSNSTSSSATDSTSTANPLVLPADQVQQLKYQIMAFQHLARNKPMPPHLASAAISPETDIYAGQPPPHSGLPLKITEAVVNHHQNHSSTTLTTTTTYPTPSQQDPHSQLPRPITSTAHAARQQRLLIPAATPVGIDPFSLMRERERRIKARIAFRIQELEALPSVLSNRPIEGGALYAIKKEEQQGVDKEGDDDKTTNNTNIATSSLEDKNTSSLKIKALIELKALRLIDKQRKLRDSVLKMVAQSTTLSTAVDRSVYRRMKKPVVRDARQTEKIERHQRLEREKREKQKSFDYLNSILNHGKDMLMFHRMAQSKSVKLGQAVLRYHSNAEKEEQKRIQRNQQERLKALKENNEEAYMKLIDQAKDTRITTILSQTNTYLSSLTNAVVAQKAHIAQGESLEVPVSSAADEFNVPDKEEDGGGLRDYYNTAHRVTETVTEQPSILVGGKLKDYQIKGLQWMISLYNNRLNGILADEMGLGKTIQTISLITYLIEKKKQPGPFLVIVPLSTIANWKLEFEKWAPSVTKVVYKGSPNERKAAQAELRHGQFNVLLTTYEYIIRDRPLLAKIKWVHMIIDEGHRMKNSQSKLSVTLMQYYSSRYRLILTGTPLQNNLPELWALLNFILPKIFNSVKSFDEWFNSPFTGAATGATERLELNEEESLLIIRRLHKVLRPFLLRRLKKDVEKELPDKVETIVKCNMSALQSKLYEQLRSRRSFYTGADNKKGSNMKALNNLVMQFRKICNHPYVFEEVETEVNPTKITDANIYRVAGKFELLDRILPKYFATDHRVLMFFQMTAIMDIMEDYLRWRGWKYLRLDGSSKQDDRGESLKVFNAKDSEIFIFLLSTRAGGLGLNLQTADTVIIYDSDWNPHQDLQAQDRAHRIGQTKEVRILRLITTKSIEEHILARAQYKLDLDGKVIQAGKFDNKTSDAEREELLRTLFGLDGEKEEEEEEEDISMNDDELNEILARNEDELVVFRKIDAERIARDKADLAVLAKAAVTSKSRLITERELPAHYLADMNEILTQEKLANDAVVFGRGTRQRADVAYDDGLTEEQFLDAVESGNLDEKIERKRRAKIKRRSGKDISEGAAASENGDDAEEDENDSVITTQPAVAPAKQARKPVAASSSGGGRGRKSDKQSAEEKKLRKKRVQFGVDVEEEDPVDGPTRKAMIRVFDICFKAVQDLEVDEDGNIRSRSELFATLPSKQHYPDYYQIIKHPIAMDWIETRIHSSYYKSVSSFQDDFNQMFTNAMTYNLEGSPVYADTMAMKQVFEEKLSEFCPEGEVVVTAEDEALAEQERLDAIQAAQRAQEEEDAEDAAAVVAASSKSKEKGKRKRGKNQVIGGDEEDEEAETGGEDGETGGGLRKKQKGSHGDGEDGEEEAALLTKVKLVGSAAAEDDDDEEEYDDGLMSDEDD